MKKLVREGLDEIKYGSQTDNNKLQRELRWEIKEACKLFQVNLSPSEIKEVLLEVADIYTEE